MRRVLLPLVLFSTPVLACSGNLVLPGTDPGSQPGEGRAPEHCDGELCVGGSAMTRLTRDQYLASVARVFGEDVRIEDSLLPPDHVAGLFASNEESPATERDVGMYAGAAEAVASLAANALPECGEDSDAACARRTAEWLGERLYRRPLTAEEQDAYAALIAWSLEEDDLATTRALLVETTLQSPHFLYRVERATPMGPSRLSGLEVASRLSLFLFREGPDEALRVAAKAGELDTAEGVREHARRMLDDPRAERTVRRFHTEWLGLGELDALVRGDEAFTEEVGRAMRQEVERFAWETFENEGDLVTLLTARWTMANPRLARFYGVEEPSEGWARVETPGRSGLLTAGGVMATHASETFTRPIHRGLLVRERFLCQELPSPPAAALDTADEATAETSDQRTDRERLEALTMVDSCAGCHVMMNPIGYALEEFDALGRSRFGSDNDHDLDVSGAIGSEIEEYRTDADGQIVGAQAMGEQLAYSQDVARCVTRQWFRYALQRKDSAVDAATVDVVQRAFVDSGLQIRELLVALVGSDAFLHRALPGDEG